MLYWVSGPFLLTVDFQGGFCLAKLILSILLLVICHGQPLLLCPAPYRHCSRGHFFCRPCKISACFVRSVHIGTPLLSPCWCGGFFSPLCVPWFWEMGLEKWQGTRDGPLLYVGVVRQMLSQEVKLAFILWCYCSALLQKNSINH